MNSGLCEPTHFGLLIDVNGKKGLVTVQHQAHGPLLRDPHKLLPRGDRETLIQALSVPSTHPLLSTKTISNRSLLCSAARLAGEPESGWEINVSEQLCYEGVPAEMVEI